MNRGKRMWSRRSEIIICKPFTLDDLKVFHVLDSIQIFKLNWIFTKRCFKTFPKSTQRRWLTIGKRIHWWSQHQTKKKMFNNPQKSKTKKGMNLLRNNKKNKNQIYRLLDLARKDLVFISSVVELLLCGVKSKKYLPKRNFIKHKWWISLRKK